MQRDMFEGFDSGSFSKAESLNDLDEITIDGRSAMVISNDDDLKIIAIEYLDSLDSEMQEFTHSEFDELMNKNSVMFEDGGSTWAKNNEKRALQYLDEDLKRVATETKRFKKSLEEYKDGDEIFSNSTIYPSGIVLDNDIDEQIIYIEFDNGEMIELPYLEAAKKNYANSLYKGDTNLMEYLGLSPREAVLKFKNNSKTKNVTVEEALGTPIKFQENYYKSSGSPKEIVALADKHDEVDRKIVWKFFPKTIEGKKEYEFPSIYTGGARGVVGHQWEKDEKGDYGFIFENEKEADEYIAKKGFVIETDDEYRKRRKRQEREMNKAYDIHYDNKRNDWDSQKDMGKMRYNNGGALDKEFKFDKNFVIYVPSTTDVGSRIRPTDLQSRVNLVEKYVAEKFGGFTRTETDGGYKASSGDIIEEDIVKVSVFAKDFDWNQHEDEVVNKVKEWAKLWGQEAIGFEYEGDLYYIDEEGKFMDGGEVEESLPYTATFMKGGKLLSKSEWLKTNKDLLEEMYDEHIGESGDDIRFKDWADNYYNADRQVQAMGLKTNTIMAEGGEVYAFGYVAPRKITIKGKKYNIFSHPKNMTFTNEQKLEVTKKLKDKGFVVKSRNIAPFGSEEKMWQLLVKKEYAEGGYVYGQKFEDKHGMLILQDRDKYDKDIWTARRYSGESKRNVGIVEVSESELSKMKRIYAEGGEIVANMFDPEVHYQVVINDDYNKPLYFSDFNSAKTYVLKNVKKQENTIINPSGDSIELSKNPDKEELSWLTEWRLEKGGSTYAEGGEAEKPYEVIANVIYKNGDNEEINLDILASNKKEAREKAFYRLSYGHRIRVGKNVKKIDLEINQIDLFAEGGEVEMIEIAEDGSNIPPKLIDIFSEFNEDEDPYKEMEKLRAKANEIGYDFSYGLDGTPTEFCEIPKKSWGGGIAIGTAVGGYVGYKIGRARKQKYGFETEKKIGRGVKKTFSRKKKMSKGGSISSHFEGELSFLNY